MSEPIEIAAARALVEIRLNTAHAFTAPRQYGPRDRSAAAAVDACREVVDAADYLEEVLAQHGAAAGDCADA